MENIIDEYKIEIKSLINWDIKDISRFDEILKTIEELWYNKWKWDVIKKIEEFNNNLK